MGATARSWRVSGTPSAATATTVAAATATTIAAASAAASAYAVSISMRKLRGWPRARVSICGGHCYRSAVLLSDELAGWGGGNGR